MISTEDGLFYLLGICILLLILRTSLAVLRSWGSPEEEVRLTKLPARLKNRPRMCHFLFMSIVLGVGLVVLLLVWFVALFIGTNILHINMDRSELKLFFFVPLLTLCGFALLAIAYSVAFLVDRRRNHMRSGNKSK